MSAEVNFFVGIHQPSDAHRFERACISVNRLRGRKKPIGSVQVLVDSGAFTELNLYGRYRHDVDTYADELHRLHSDGIVEIVGAVAQDYMCEAFMLAKTGLTIADHQRLTIERYDALVAALQSRFGGACPFPVLPVLQGYQPADYIRHLDAYGWRLTNSMWVGVGSVCKRNGTPDSIVDVLSAIAERRPDLRLHGFGVKMTALRHAGVRDLLTTADSMAWSWAARKARLAGDKTRDANSWHEARAFSDAVQAAAQHPITSYQTNFLWLFDMAEVA